jgi:hypothetical protein
VARLSLASQKEVRKKDEDDNAKLQIEFDPVSTHFLGKTERTLRKIN